MRNAPEELRALSKELAASTSPEDRHLSLLATAAAEFRSDDMKACLAALDRIDSLVPASNLTVHAVASKLRSNTLTMLGDPWGGEKQATLGLEKLGHAPLYEERVSLLIVRAEALYVQYEFDKSQEQLTIAWHLADSIGYLRGKANVENTLGNIRLAQSRYAEAWRHFSEALDMANASGSEMMAQNAVANLGTVAIVSGEYEKALHLYDSLLTVLGPRSPELRAMLLSHTGTAYRKMKANDAAIASFNLALHLQDSIGDLRGKAKAQQQLGTALWEAGRQNEAFDMMQRTLLSAEQLNWQSLREEIHIELYDWCYALGRKEEALEHLRSYVALADSLNAARFNDELARSEVLFDTERKEHHITEQDQALLLAGEQDRRKSVQRNIAIGSTAALVVLALLLWRSLRTRRKLAQQEHELHAKRVDELMHEHEIAAINAMLEGQEKERDRLAIDLHDRLGSMLSGIKHQLSSVEEDVQVVQQSHRTHYSKMHSMLDDAVGEVRRISHDMITVTLSRFGLEKALEDLCDTVRVTGRLEVELRTFGLEHRMERSLEIAVYRIVQESISNVLKHAHATELSVDVTRVPGRLSVIVHDNGKGFDTAEPRTGIGLENVRIRATAISATLCVESTPGKGTSVSVEGAVVE